MGVKLKHVKLICHWCLLCSCVAKSLMICGNAVLLIRDEYTFAFHNLIQPDLPYAEPNSTQSTTGWAKKVIPLVQCNVMYERYHFFGPPCMYQSYFDPTRLINEGSSSVCWWTFVLYRCSNPRSLTVSFLSVCSQKVRCVIDCRTIYGDKLEAVCRTVQLRINEFYWSKKKDTFYPLFNAYLFGQYKIASLINYWITFLTRLESSSVL